VLFDLYRTLIDITTDERKPEVWERLASFLRYRGLQADASAMRRTFFSRAEQTQADSDEAHPEVDVLAIFREMLRGMGHDEPEDDGDGGFAVAVTQLFRVLSMVHFGLYPDTLRTLRALHGTFRLGLVSDAQRFFIEPEIRILGLDRFFDVVVISSCEGFHKPDPRMFRRALERLGLEPEQVTYVGDHVERDICGARQARLRTVLIRRDGVPETRDPPCLPDHTIRTLDELPALLGA
jgi:putative hydrolase of the HAD superfamily